MKKTIRKHVLKNALEHEGKASAGAVINRVIGEKPELLVLLFCNAPFYAPVDSLDYRFVNI